ncbi:MAG: helix-turn-helix domain-containing protein [Xanthomonadales bacterium]|nr:helix-turn-helix domain-containing protein [Xanthomonadales bacterium]
MTDPPTSQDCALLRLAPALKQAREERGLSLAQVATDLKLPQHVLEHLEHGQFEQLGAAVFARGYMRSYARHLGVDERLCDDEYTVLAGALPPLTSRQHTPRLRVWTDRYAVKAVYVVLTLAIVVPALFVAKQFAPGSLLRPQHSLDEPSTSSLDLSAHRASPASAPAGSAGDDVNTSAQHENVEAVRASLAPLFDSAPRVAELSAPAAAGPTSLPVASNGWVFEFRGDSWVEIVDAAGQRLEFGIVKSGRQLRYGDDELGRIAIGNAEAVQIRYRGEAVDMTPFRRANVARFRVSSGGELAPAGG